MPAFRVLLLLPLLALALAAACDSGATKYDVSVSFNTTVTQGDLDAVAALLHRYDEDADVLVQESFPPTVRATIETDAEDFCVSIEAELEARPAVERVSCEEHREQPASASPDAPVSLP
jgi:hypothetical protein